MFARYRATFSTSASLMCFNSINTPTFTVRYRTKKRRVCGVEAEIVGGLVDATPGPSPTSSYNVGVFSRGRTRSSFFFFLL